MRPIRVLFEPYLLYHLPQFLPFYELIRDNSRFDIRFSTSGHSPEQVEMGRGALRELGVNSIEAGSEQERFDAIDRFDPDILFVGWGRRGYLERVHDRPRPAVFMIYHGIGVKASYYRDDDPRINYRVVESPYRAQQLADHGSKSEALLAGCVKLDPLYDRSSFPRERTLARLGLDPSRKTVLYAPTYYPASIGTIGRHIATASADHNLIIKLHDYTLFHAGYRDDLLLMRDTAAANPHVRLLGPEWYNIIPIFKAADILVTDASSVMFEYLVLDRPVVVCTRHKLFLRHRLAPWIYRRNRIDTQTSAFGGFYSEVRTGRELASAIERDLAEPDRLAAQRRATREKLLHFDDGRSAQRLLEHFERIVASGQCTRGESDRASGSDTP